MCACPLRFFVFVYIGIATADFVLILWILLVVEKFIMAKWGRTVI